MHRLGVEGRTARSSQNSGDVNRLYMRLEENENIFNETISQLEQITQGMSTLNNRDIRQVIRGTFDAMRDTTLDLFDSTGNNSDSGEPQELSTVAANNEPMLPVESNTPDASVSVHADQNDIFAQLEAYASDCRRNSQRQSEPDPFSESMVTSSLDSVPLLDTDDDTSTVGPLSDRSDQPRPAVETSPVDSSGIVGGILAMLRRMARRLQGFFSWLLNKIKEAAVWVWNKVCEAFSGIFIFLRNVWHRVRGRAPEERFQQQDQQKATEDGQQERWQHPALSAGSVTHRVRVSRMNGSQGSVHHYSPLELSWQSTARFHTA